MVTKLVEQVHIPSDPRRLQHMAKGVPGGAAAPIRKGIESLQAGTAELGYEGVPVANPGVSRQPVRLSHMVKPAVLVIASGIGRILSMTRS